MLWVIAISGIALIVCGWFLPWYVELTSNGIGFSPMDAVLNFTGIGTIVLYVVGLGMLSLLGGALYDIFCVATHRGTPFRYSRLRAVIALCGVAAVTVISILIGVLHEEPLFGNLSPFSVTDNAVWMTLTGFALCAFAYGLRGWISHHGGIAFTAVAFAVGAAFPMIFNQSADFVGWGARFAAIYVLLALGLNVVVGFAGLLDLGYAAFFAIGAYTTAALSGPHYGLHLPFWVIIFLGAAVASLFGAVLWRPDVAPARRLPRHRDARIRRNHPGPCDEQRLRRHRWSERTAGVPGLIRELQPRAARRHPREHQVLLLDAPACWWRSS